MAFPPGPRTPGTIALLQWMRDPTGSFERGFREWGDIYSVRNPLFGHEVVVSHPDLVRQLFTGDPEVFHAGETNKALGPILGQHSVLMLDGRDHHRERKLLMPPFHGERLGVYADVMREITDSTIDDLPLKKRLGVLPFMQRITFEVILETVFGAREGAAIDALRERLTKLVEVAQSPFGMLWMLPAFQRDLGPLTGWAKLQRTRAAADESIYGIIADARAALADGATKRDDVLSMLLAARDEDGQPMSDQELRDELMTLLLAGHETTATSLAWAVEEIVRRPEILARVREEIAAAPAGATHRAPLPYLDATIKEVLRLRPISALLARRVTQPIKLREWDIPAGTYVVIPMYNVQRHPDFWEAPLELRPERFLDKKPDPYAWLPFGGGPRRCIGMAFALLEMRVVLATLLSRVKLELTHGPAKVALRSFLFAPEGGTRVMVEERAPRAA